jgi:hypothetical protein
MDCDDAKIGAAGGVLHATRVLEPQRKVLLLATLIPRPTIAAIALMLSATLG